jgi:hypothetical protein
MEMVALQREISSSVMVWGFRCSKDLVPSVFSESLETLAKDISGNNTVDTKLEESVKLLLGVIQCSSKLAIAVFHQKIKGLLRTSDRICV